MKIEFVSPEEAKNYIDISDELSKYVNKDRYYVIDKKMTEKRAAEKNISSMEAEKELIKERDALPKYTDESKAKEILDLRDECIYALKHYCIDNEVFITDDQHQNALCPIFDDKWTIMLSLRSWSAFMAEVWNEILRKDLLCYLDFYCACEPEIIADYRRKKKNANK